MTATHKTITWVSDISDPDQRQVRYINVAFSDNDTGYIGKKDYDAALEVHGLLTEAKNQGEPVEFVLESTGKKNKNDGDKYKIKSFGPSGGNISHTVPEGVQGGGGKQDEIPRSPARPPERSWTPRFTDTPEGFAYNDERVDRRKAVELAIAFVQGQTPAKATTSMWIDVDTYTESIYKLLRKTSASEAHRNGSSTAISTDAEERGQAGEGEEPLAFGEGVGNSESPACPPHQCNFDVAPKAMRYPCLKCGAWIKPARAHVL